ncbi:uncharacterized protein E0L32_002081 [Thyridium curvatum]|uniref:Uncharacterized protein n=1 Tax=Thyridium curvatum TaxID=1093900 RepID=A0A507ARC5_9PEZI|nr:uncharacterized protein E0L32_002052 [Thyridium curvatum]XP_030989189.1 uncharacterized protein E0L32_002081 [Thyridium curvatum]TPX07449.1 hypothetical protein E0L32_002052 [Thyridium curvatum]TPX07478.1 hypothetical protein E0L32_002081 [Thyridium curvatum]
MRKFFSRATGSGPSSTRHSSRSSSIGGQTWSSAIPDAACPPSPAPSYHTIDPSLPDAIKTETSVLAQAEKGPLHDQKTQEASPPTRPAQARSSGPTGFSVLYAAAVHGHLGTVKLLLGEGGVDLEGRTKAGATPLIGACSGDNAPVVKLLLDHGADIATKDRSGWTPIGAAASNGRLEIVRLLLDRGADPNPQMRGGWTPLHLAARKGHAEVVDLLMSRGADSTHYNFEGETPLHVAAMTGQTEVVRALLKHGARITALDKRNQTPIDLASPKGHWDAVELLMAERERQAGRAKGKKS